MSVGRVRGEETTASRARSASLEGVAELPSFRMNWYVIPHQPDVNWRLPVVVAALAALMTTGEEWFAREVILAVPIFSMAWFPIWRKIAVRNPSLSSFRTPRLLDEAEKVRHKRT